jgi:exopolysaccharide biosynthesis WecB/TagA/CpsF family protein
MATVLDIDDYDLDEAVAIVAVFGTERFGYVVTPNVDHVIRYHDDAQFRELYAHAAFVLLDSRFLAHILGLLKLRRHRVCPGSDLTTAVLENVAKSNDAIVVVGSSAAQAEEIRARFAFARLHHIAPPMNFIDDPEAVETCLREIEAASPFRFCFLAVGSPQQEIVAHKLKGRGIARGLALCVGGSINFLTGVEKRAPRWTRRMGLEWLFRLLQDPRRLAKRYLLRGPRIFFLLPRLELRSRRPVPVPAKEAAYPRVPLKR